MDDIKNLILDKAKDRFDRFGYKKTTMDEISRDCKISKKTIYSFFDNKENLLISLFQRETIRVQETIFSGLGEISDPLDKLVLLIKKAVGYFREDNFLTRLLKDENALFSTSVNTKNLSIDLDVIKIIAEIIHEGKQHGKFRDVDEQVIAYAGFKLFQAFSFMKTMEFCKEKDEQDYYTDVLIDFLVNGLVKK